MDFVELLKKLEAECDKYAAMEETLRAHLPAPDQTNKLIHMAGQFDGITLGIKMAMDLLEQADG